MSANAPDNQHDYSKLEDAINSLLEVILYVLKAKRGNVMLLDKDTGHLEVKFARGHRDGAIGNVSFKLGEGIAGWVAANDKPLVVPQVKKEPLFIKEKHPFCDGKKITSIICVPLRANGELIGVVNVDDGGEEKNFKYKDLKTAEDFADRMGKTLESASEREIEGMLKGGNLTSFSEFTYEFKTGTIKTEVGSIFNSSVKKLFENADSALLFLFDENNGSINLESSFGVDENIFSHFNLYQRHNCMIQEKKQALLVRDRGAVNFICLDCFGEYEAKSMMVAPLLVESELKGLMVVGSKFPHSFSSNDFHIFKIIVGQISLLYRIGLSYNELKSYSDNIISSVNSGVVSTDLKGNIAYVNAAAERILQIEREQVLERHYSKFKESFDIEKFESILNNIISTGISKHSLKIDYYLSEGVTLKLSVQLSLLRDAQKKAIGFVAVFEDVTEKSELEDQLRRAERLAVAGQLASGTAHEIRNPLTSIKGFAQMLHKVIPEDKEYHQYTSFMLEEVESINNIVKQMESLSREDNKDSEWLDLAKVIDEAMGEVALKKPNASVKVIKNYSDGIPPVLGDYFRIKQVFYHIITNGFESMNEEGKLEIKMELEPPDVVKVTINDRGTGIPVKEIEQIFNPFYTGRPEGVGLGLAISYKIIRDHGGLIDVESKLGKGTTIIVKLPINCEFSSLLAPIPALQHC